MVHPQQAVFFKGKVIERTNSLRYLGIHFDRTLKYKTQIEPTKLRHRKFHQPPLYQSVIFSVLDYNIGLAILS